MRLERLVPAFGGLILIIRATWGFGCRINGMFWIRRYFSGKSKTLAKGSARVNQPEWILGLTHLLEMLMISGLRAHSSTG